MDQQHQQHASDTQSETNIQQPIENQIIEYLRTLDDNHDTHDQQWIKSLLEDIESPGQQEEHHVEDHTHPPQEHMEPNNTAAITTQSEASQMEEDPKDEPTLTKEEVPSH
ncbi:13535_t:CDS:2 [Acaulospora morrowiae]|uniref:13535_t:CDS:1 n=1 Tax=Acaulospora morrowiae TaxID=94023 RepID=A0A9N8ZJC0_9GLOM|nr:13535_t:CDS:2 [Acaulospora morrowiae]